MGRDHRRYTTTNLFPEINNITEASRVTVITNDDETGKLLSC